MTRHRVIKKRKVALVLTKLRNRRRSKKSEPLREGTFYVTSFCNFPHRLIDGMPIRHECYQLDSKKLKDEREGRDVKTSMIKSGPVRGVRH